MSLPLSGVRVLELAGLAPGPFAGMVLADFGADVVRVDRAGAGFNVDVLTRGKRSIAVSLKSQQGIALVRNLLSASTGNKHAWRADILIDPFRPGVLERIGLDPIQLIEANPALIVARLTGFRRQGPYSSMAGHDINYVALSGVLAMLGRKGDKPYFPANLLADFAGGGMIAVVGILAALIERGRSGKGQIVEIDMVTGTRYIASFPLLMSNPALNLPLWSHARGENLLDGGAPWYDVYETRDGGYMSVGALENHFYSTFLDTLNSALPADFPHPTPSPADQMERSTWPALEQFLTAAFRLKTRQEWTQVFIGTESCCVPVLSKDEIDSAGRNERDLNCTEETRSIGAGGEAVPDPAPSLVRTPCKTGGKVDATIFLEPGKDTREVLVQAGFEAGHIDDLVRLGAVTTGDEEQSEKAKL
ncbi:CaiB/BaiF CoA transferase family protein [Sporobolomyces koalae]|uniref:CaiB/BaiF CoA transferase family protein n=1 Tax=Sporobolomyces koalae TaxID=500713 RepID=UPI00317BD616